MTMTSKYIHQMKGTIIKIRKLSTKQTALVILALDLAIALTIGAVTGTLDHQQVFAEPIDVVGGPL
jgi:hypothetical protein